MCIFILIPIGLDILPFVFVKLRHRQHFNVVIPGWSPFFQFWDGSEQRHYHIRVGILIWVSQQKDIVCILKIVSFPSPVNSDPLNPFYCSPSKQLGHT